MEKLLEELLNDISNESGEITLDNFWDYLKYDTSFFVNVSSTKKKWFLKNIDMAENDKEIIFKVIKSMCDKYVDEYKIEDRDSEFIYKYDIEGLLQNSNRIQVAFADSEENYVSNEDTGVRPEITIHNYEGNGYPPNDEVKLIVHRLIIGKSKILVFCNQTNTSLATTSIKTRIENKLENIEKNKYYKIKNDISFLMTEKSYYISAVEYFEGLFSFGSEISRQKLKAMATLNDCKLIEEFELVVPELNKGYMARSVSMIRMNKSEITTFVKKNKNVISNFCREFEAGVNFDKKTNKFTVIDGKLAALFITYLFSYRMSQNMLGDVVYYKTFNKLNKNTPVTIR